MKLPHPTHRDSRKQRKWPPRRPLPRARGSEAAAWSPGSRFFFLMAAPRPHPRSPRVSPALLPASPSEVSSPDPRPSNRKGRPGKGSARRTVSQARVPAPGPGPAVPWARCPSWPGGQGRVQGAGIPRPLPALTAPPLPCPAETQQGHHGPQATPEGRCGPGGAARGVCGPASRSPSPPAARHPAPRASCCRSRPRSWRRRWAAGRRRSRTTCRSTARRCISPAPCLKCR